MLMLFEYLAKVMLWFVVAGALWYELDRVVGVRVVRFFYKPYYNWTSETPLPSDWERGFVYKTPSSQQWTTATVVSIIESYILLRMGKVTFTEEAIAAVIGIVAIWIGFKIGRFVQPISHAVVGFFKKVEDVSERPGETADAVKNDVVGRFASFRGWIKRVLGLRVTSK